MPNGISFFYIIFIYTISLSFYGSWFITYIAADEINIFIPADMEY